MNRMLLIVDPQVDFITGSLPVPGAADAMDALARYVREHEADYELKVVTADWHPYRHSSFDREGGQWPPHCVQHSVGAALWQALLEALNETRGGYTLLTKGDRVEKEEYSILQNGHSAAILLRLIRGLNIERVDICGLAGNVCVLTTAQDMVSAVGTDGVNVLEAYSPSLDDGSALRAFAATLGGK